MHRRIANSRSCDRSPARRTINRDRPHLATSLDPISTIVYCARPSDVRTTIIDGQIVVDEFRLIAADADDIVAGARAEAHALAARAF